MVRRRSTVRFRNGALEPKHGKRHLIRSESCRVAFLLSGCYGSCRSPTGVCAEYVPKFSALGATLAGRLGAAVLGGLAGVAEGFLNAPFGDGVLPVEALGVDL